MDRPLTRMTSCLSLPVCAVHIYYDGGVSRCSPSMDMKITGPDERDEVNVNDPTFHEFWRVAQLCNIAKYVLLVLPVCLSRPCGDDAMPTDCCVYLSMFFVW